MYDPDRLKAMLKQYFQGRDASLQDTRCVMYSLGIGLGAEVRCTANDYYKLPEQKSPQDQPKLQVHSL